MPCTNRSDPITEITTDTQEVADSLLAKSLSTLLNLIREQLGLDVMFVSEFLDGRRVFRHVSTDPMMQIIRVGDSHAMEDSICQRVMDGRVPKLVRDLRVLRTRQKLPEVTKPIGAHISVPVRLADGRVYGTLCGFAIGRAVELTQRDVRRMEVAAQATARLLAQAAGHSASIALEIP